MHDECSSCTHHEAHTLYTNILFENQKDTVIDGDLDTFWSSQKDYVSGEWLDYDLGREIYIKPCVSFQASLGRAFQEAQKSEI